MGTRGGATNALSTTVSEKASERPKVRVLYDFEYEYKSKPIKIAKDEKLILVQRTNKDWWQVIRPEDTEGFYVPEHNTFYVPTGYVKEEEPLPDSTRFYVDKDKMFKPEGNASQPSPPHSNQDNHRAGQQDSKDEPKKGHDSFRSVIRKLSGNLGSVNDKDNKAAKPAKPSKLIKLRKNSTDSSSDDVKLPAGKSSLLPSKHKDSWESSAFGMCFGRDTKNVDAQVLNPFQEELENALSNRTSMRRTTILDTKLGVNKQAGGDQVTEEKENSAKVQSKFENIHDRWEKATSQVLKKTDNNFQFVPLSKIKEDAQKRRSASPNFKIEANSNSVGNAGAKRLSEIEKLYSKVEKVESKLMEKVEMVEKIPKKAVQIIPEQEVESGVGSKPVADAEPPTKISKNEDIANKASVEEPKADMDRLLINDKRKMWAIETLMSELLQSSSQSKPPSGGEKGDTCVAGPGNQLAQELHDMNASRRYEVNPLEEDEDDTKESWKRKRRVFDFPPPPPPPSSCCSNVAPQSPTARSPKLLDEYNEANILNDVSDKVDCQQQRVTSSNESPCYSSISLRAKRDKVPCQLSMPTKHFRDELQLTPSLEKLASEIKFLPASCADKLLDLDCPTSSTTLSQDSLRLYYKRRSKSDGALNKRLLDTVARRRDSADSSQAEMFEPKEQQHVERKYTQHYEGHRVNAGCTLKRDPSAHQLQTEYYYRPAADGQQQQQQQQQTARYNKLSRKSRSLGDLDCSEMDESKEEVESSRRMYKPVPKLRSKESLRRMKPVPAKRRVQPQRRAADDLFDSSSFDSLSDSFERSTAVGFKSLLRASESGSEEFLQYKTFPATSKAQQQHHHHHHQYQLQLSPYEQQTMSRSDGNVNLSRSSSSRILEDTSLENLVELPPGWTQSYDNLANRVCFVNGRGDKWFSSNDAEGKIYFFEENSNQSSWALPSEAESRARTGCDWPQLFDGNMCILKEGLINKTKITSENGKKLRKAWSTSYAVLTELFLLFFKDEKTFAAMKMDPSAAAKPDITVDLNGAFVESADKLSNRKNVYVINTLLGLQVLMQWDNATVVAEWYRGIRDAIQRLPFSQEYGRSSSSRD